MRGSIASLSVVVIGGFAQICLRFIPMPAHTLYGTTVIYASDLARTNFLFLSCSILQFTYIIRTFSDSAHKGLSVISAFYVS